MLSELVGSEKCKVFSYGMGAISAILLTLLKQGDHMIMLNTIYGEAYSFAKYIQKFSIELTKVYIEKPEEITHYIQDNTKNNLFRKPIPPEMSVTRSSRNRTNCKVPQYNNRYGRNLGHADIFKAF